MGSFYQQAIEPDTIRPVRRVGQQRQRRKGASILLLLIAGTLGVVLARHFWPRPEYMPLGSRGEFSSGACVQYGPSAGNSGPSVFIDPGHGGPDPGVQGITTSGTAVMEKTETLAVAMDLMHRLASNGYRVALSRVTDTSVVQEGAGMLSGGMYTLAGEHADLEARIDCANAAGASLLLSIHFNGYSDPSVGGTATIYDDARSFTSRNERFADQVQSAVLGTWTSNRITIPDRGVTADSDAGTPAATAAGAAYGHLLLLGPASANYLSRPTTMPGALSEPLFLTDGPEASLANGSFGQKLLAAAYGHAIDQYFGRGG